MDSLFSGLVLRLFPLLFVSVKSHFITYQMAYIVTKSVGNFFFGMLGIELDYVHIPNIRLFNIRVSSELNTS